MKPVFLLLIVMCVFAAAFALCGCKGQERGLNGSTFVSNGRPALAVTPALSMKLTDAAWCDVAPKTRASDQASAKIWYSLYDNNESGPKEARLLVLLAEGMSDWEWPFEPGTQRDIIQRDEIHHNSMTVHTETIVMPAAKDPWADMWHTQWKNGSLTRRFRIFFMQRCVKLLVEYREAIDPNRPLPPHRDMQLLTDFEKRSVEAFSLALRDAGDNIPEVTDRLGTAPKALSRRALADWLGEMYKRGQLSR